MEEIKISLKYLSIINPNDLVDKRKRLDNASPRTARIKDNRNRISYEKIRGKRTICMNCAKSIMHLTMYMHVKMKSCQRNKILFNTIDNILTENK